MSTATARHLLMIEENSTSKPDWSLPMTILNIEMSFGRLSFGLMRLKWSCLDGCEFCLAKGRERPSTQKHSYTRWWERNAVGLFCFFRQREACSGDYVDILEGNLKKSATSLALGHRRAFQQDMTRKKSGNWCKTFWKILKSMSLKAQIPIYLFIYLFIFQNLLRELKVKIHAQKPPNLEPEQFATREWALIPQELTGTTLRDCCQLWIQKIALLLIGCQTAIKISFVDAGFFPCFHFWLWARRCRR